MEQVGRKREVWKKRVEEHIGSMTETVMSACAYKPLVVHTNRSLHLVFLCCSVMDLAIVVLKREKRSKQQER